MLLWGSPSEKGFFLSRKLKTFENSQFEKRVGCVLVQLKSGFHATTTEFAGAEAWIGFKPLFRIFRSLRVLYGNWAHAWTATILFLARSCFPLNYVEAHELIHRLSELHVCIVDKPPNCGEQFVSSFFPSSESDAAEFLDSRQ